MDGVYIRRTQVQLLGHLVFHLVSLIAVNWSKQRQYGTCLTCMGAATNRSRYFRGRAATDGQNPLLAASNALSAPAVDDDKLSDYVPNSRDISVSRAVSRFTSMWTAKLASANMRRRPELLPWPSFVAGDSLTSPALSCRF